MRKPIWYHVYLVSTCKLQQVKMLTFSRDSSNLIKYIYFKKSTSKVKLTNIFFFINFFSQRQWTLLLIKCYNVPLPTHSILPIKLHFNYSKTPNIHEFLLNYWSTPAFSAYPTFPFFRSDFECPLITFPSHSSAIC